MADDKTTELPDSVELSDEENQELMTALTRLVERTADEPTEDNPKDFADVIGDGKELLSLIPDAGKGEVDASKRKVTTKKASRQDAINWLSRFLGRRDNRGAFIWNLTEFKGYVGYAYCGATQLAACEALGLDIAPVTSNARLLYCPSVVQDARAAGKFKNSKTSKPGDWCLHDWSGDGIADHITMVLVNDPSKEYITVIGGNHGDGKTSGERGVFIRTWPRSVVMGTVDRSDSYGSGGTTTSTPKPATSGGTLQLGSEGKDVAALQAGAMKIFPSYAGTIKNSGGADGVFGQGTKAFVIEFQKRSHLEADGIVGPKTKAALFASGVRF